MKSYSQPEGEQVSDAQDGQEGKCKIPPLKRRKKKREGWGEEMRKQDRGSCFIEVQTLGLFPLSAPPPSAGI